MKRSLIFFMIVGLVLAIGNARAALLPDDPEPVQLFSFDFDPACRSSNCIPEGGTFYPGRAEKKGARFKGEAIRVPEGTDVKFTNISSQHHAIASFKKADGQPLFQSSEHVLTGTSSLLGTQFLRPGTYPYFCPHHPTTMFGLIKIVR
jgi:plastocyanin